MSSSAPTVITVIVLFLTAFLATANGHECGRVKVATSLSIGSEYAIRGQWPWLVPLLKNDSDKYFCGSTIVSERHLISGECNRIE
jgi:secreted trypsin-like serine protease